MWVIYCTETGEELDRVESQDDRDDVVRDFDQTNIWDYRASYRWED